MKKLDTWSRLGGKKELPSREAGRKSFAAIAHEEIPRLVWAHKAWMLMMVKQGVIDKERGTQILGALASVDVDEMIETYDERFDKPILQLERYLGEKVGEHASDVLAGRTLPPPVYRMRVREKMLPFIEATHELMGCLLEYADKYKHAVMPGYTHLSHAQPMTYGHYLLGLYEAVARASKQVELAYTASNQSDMGCGALAGTSFNIDRQMLADDLGFDGIVEHSTDSVAATDFAVDLVNALTNLAIPISRVANEMDVWTTFEANMLEISDEIAATSSMMPQKKNATICEHLRYALGAVMGYYSEIVGGAHCSSYGDTMEMMFIWKKAAEISAKGTWLCKRMKTLVENMSVHEDIMLKHAREGFSTASELASAIFREKGKPWRVCHAIVGGVVRKMCEEGRTAMDITPEVVDEVAAAVTGEPLGMSAESIAAAIDPVKFVEAYDSQGGVAPAEVARMIEARKPQLAEAKARQVERRKRLEDAEAELNAAIAEMVG